MPESAVDDAAVKAEKAESEAKIRQLKREQTWMISGLCLLGTILGIMVMFMILSRPKIQESTVQVNLKATDEKQPEVQKPDIDKDLAFDVMKESDVVSGRNLRATLPKGKDRLTLFIDSLIVEDSTWVGKSKTERTVPGNDLTVIGTNENKETHKVGGGLKGTLTVKGVDLWINVPRVNFAGKDRYYLKLTKGKLTLIRMIPG